MASEPSLIRRGLLALAIAVAVAMAACLIGAYAIEERSQRQALDDGATAVRELFRLQIERDAAAMRAAIQDMTNDRAVRDAMTRGDHDELLRLVQPLFTELRTQQRIIRLSFIDTDRKAVLRVDDPERPGGGTVEHATLLEAADKGTDTYGLELSPLGTLTLRTVTPWRDGTGKLVGYVELGEEVGPVADEIQHVLGMDLILLVRKDLMNRDRWDEGQRKYGRHDSWDEVNSMVAVAQTTMSIPGHLAELVDEGSQPGKVVLGDANRQVDYVDFLPLTDVGGRDLGEMVLLRDGTQLRQAFDRVVEIAAAVALLGGIIAAAVLVSMLKRAEQGLRRGDLVERRLGMLTVAGANRRPVDLTVLLVEAVGGDLPPGMTLPDHPIMIAGDGSLLKETVATFLTLPSPPSAWRIVQEDEVAVVEIDFLGNIFPLGVAERLFEGDFGGQTPELALAVSMARHVARLHGTALTGRTLPDGSTQLRLVLPSGQTVEAAAEVS